MTDRESIIRAIETCFVNWIDRYTHTVSLSDSDLEKARQMKEDALTLLKELDSIVKCKDCKHRPLIPNGYVTGFDLAFVDDVCPCHCDDPYYSWYPPDDWYCANGERR